MLDAVRVAGRWVSKPLLERLSARSQGPDAPTRHAMLKEFCRLTSWRDRKGRLCLSTANRGIQRLEKAGVVRFPPPLPIKARSGPRQLRDDGLPLPPLPQLPRSVELIEDLNLYLIADDEDPHHALWNRLISREHPLRGAPLVGAQLRYLIRSGDHALGAFGFGPASFYLSARDSWIGWDSLAREQNRSKVLGLSRFLLRPGLTCANLPTRCYGLVLQRVRADWEQRYGIVPELVETYVDRSTQSGRSLAAANWLRIGTTQGRGRTSPSRKLRPKSCKDLWVWQWEQRARERLQERSLPRVVPRSVFHPGTQPSWIDEELDGLELGHVKLDRRFAAMLQARWLHPNWSFYSSFDGKLEGIAAYDFLQNPRAELSFESLLAPHQESTRRRMAAESVVLLAQDTTTLSYNTLLETEGLGPIGNEPKSGRGLLLHTLQAFRLDGIPLGCAWAEVWARDAKSDTRGRNQQSIDQKESGRWVDAYQAASAAACQMPRTTIVVCGDRESDIIELLDHSTVAPENLRLLVRAQHDRTLGSGEKLREHLSRQPLGGTLAVEIPRNGAHPSRIATLELRWARVQIVPPQVGCKKSWGSITLWALEAKEIGSPAGVEPIDWVLLTDMKVDSLKDAHRLVRWYGLRWGIECWHQVLKDGCGVETRQMKSAQALKRSLVLDMIVAWRVLLHCRLGRSHPDLHASVLYGPEELAILEVLKKKAPLPESFDPSQCLSSVVAPSTTSDPEGKELRGTRDEEAPACAQLTLFQANLLVAMLGGFWGRKSDGNPGPDLLGRGLVQLALLVRWERLRNQSDRSQPRGKGPHLSRRLNFRAKAGRRIPRPLKSSTTQLIE